MFKTVKLFGTIVKKKIICDISHRTITGVKGFSTSLTTAITWRVLPRPRRWRRTCTATSWRRTRTSPPRRTSSISLRRKVNDEMCLQQTSVWHHWFERWRHRYKFLWLWRLITDMLRRRKLQCDTFWIREKNNRFWKKTIYLDILIIILASFWLMCFEKMFYFSLCCFSLLYFTAFVWHSQEGRTWK